jgi:hypothetical protein
MVQYFGQSTPISSKRQGVFQAKIGAGIFFTMVIFPVILNYIIDLSKQKNALKLSKMTPPPSHLQKLVYDKALKQRTELLCSAELLRESNKPF